MLAVVVRELLHHTIRRRVAVERVSTPGSVATQPSMMSYEGA